MVIKMKKVFIKYNPYKLETEMLVDGDSLKANSTLLSKSQNGTRLQEWVEELPEELYKEFNDNEFDITFHGTLLDYEDMQEVLERAKEAGNFKYSLTQREAKETSDKEELIKELFNKIINGPFEELRDDEIKNSFEQALGSDFEVCVVATMSAGKSTLINAMLGSKLMPSKQEACTAIITRIKDVDGEKNKWSASVYNSNSEIIEEHRDLTYEKMAELNENDSVSCIDVTGDIPFVEAEDVSLVLTDTPGPNNSRDPEHKKKQREFLGKTSKSLVLYIMESTFGSDDDNALLSDVAESMAVGGKQSKDRFLFVVNKMDNRRKEDGDTAESLQRINKYLKEHGIENPNLFPAAALPALYIRLLNAGVELDHIDPDETEYLVGKLNKRDYLHLEKYSSLPNSIQKNIEAKFEKYQEDADDNNQALIHTGIVTIEAAIRQYVQKYAKTAKIKNIVDTFTHKLDDVGCFENTKKELASNQKEADKIVEQIRIIKEKINDGKSAQQFKSSVEAAKEKVCKDSKQYVKNINTEYRKKVNKKIEEYRDTEISVPGAKREIEYLKAFTEKMQDKFREELEDLINDTLVKTSENLIKQYQNKVLSLTDELNVTSSIDINPLDFIKGQIADQTDIDKFIKTKEVEDGKEYIVNTDKKWYKPWTWFQEDGFHAIKYKEVEYIEGYEFAQKFLSGITESLTKNSKKASEYSQEQATAIVKTFNKEFDKLDDLIKSKLDELKSYATDKEKAEERVKESQRKIDWLEEIKNELEKILEI